MNLMTSEPLGANLIERYLSTRGIRYFRGAHETEYFYVANSRPYRLHVHLEISPVDLEISPEQHELFIRVTPACFFPVSDRPLLSHFADRWNKQDREVTAVVHESSDPQRVGVVALRSRWIRGGFNVEDVHAFEDFTAFVDCGIAAAIEFFSELTPVAVSA